MGVLSVVAAAAAAWVFGAVWYGIVGRHWMAAAGLTEGTINRKNYTAFVGSFICCLLVAGMGAFIAVPWIATNYMFAERRFSLTVIDGIYAAVGCTLMGAILLAI